jgi:hypothetical protein
MSNNYIDDLGRTHTNPIKSNDPYPTNNAWIYSGIHETLRRMNNRPGPNQYRNGIMLCKISPGLYSRHPFPYRTQPGMTPISHDEEIGIAMLINSEAREINQNKPYFCDIPGYEKKLVYSLPDKTKAASQYLYRVVIKKESQRKITRDYPALFGIFFTHRMQYRYIYESLSRMDRTFLNAMCWGSSRIIDSLTNSISLLHYMARIRMEQVGNDSILFKLVSKLMDKAVNRKYGPRPVEKMLEEYLTKANYGVLDKDHPWLVEIREYYETKGA